MEGFSAYQEQEVIIQDGLLYNIINNSSAICSDTNKPYRIIQLEYKPKKDYLKKNVS